MCNQEANVLPTGYIDDIAILAWAETTEKTCDILGRQNPAESAAMGEHTCIRLRPRQVPAYTLHENTQKDRCKLLNPDHLGRD